MMADARFAVGEEPSWSPWRDTALTVLAEALLLAGDTERASACFAESIALGDQRWATPTRSSWAMRSSRCWRWIAGAGTRPQTTSGRALDVIDENRMHDYAVGPAGVRRRRPAGAAPRGPERGQPTAVAGHEGSRLVHLRAALAHAFVCSCSWPRCTSPSPT